MRLALWVGFKPILENRVFRGVLELFLLLCGRKTKSAQGQLKERSNQKVGENKPALKQNFLSKNKWMGLDFEVEYLTEP